MNPEVEAAGRSWKECAAARRRRVGQVSRGAEQRVVTLVSILADNIILCASLGF